MKTILSANANRPTLALTLLAACLAAPCARAALLGNFVSKISVYDDPASVRVGYEVPAGENTYLMVAGEYGDSVELAGGGGIFAGLSLEYYANYARPQGLTVRLYALDAGGNPGSLLDSRQVDVRSGGAVLDVSFGYNLANGVGGSLAYTVEFAGVGNGLKAGLIVPDRAPSAGASPDTYLQRSGADWSVATVAGILEGARLRARSRSDGNVDLGLQGDAATKYVIQKWAGAGTDEWLEVARLVTDENGAASLVLTDPSEGAHLYRANTAD